MGVITDCIQHDMINTLHDKYTKNDQEMVREYYKQASNHRPHYQELPHNKLAEGASCKQGIKQEKITGQGGHLDQENAGGDEQE